MSTREPTGPGEPGEPGDSGDRVSEDEAWAEIVAHYGEHPEFTPPAPEPVIAHVFDDDVDEEPAWEEDDDPFLPGDFVAPEPAPLGWHGWRSLAWIGVLGAPAVALLWTILVQITGWHAPTLLGYFLGAAFLGGFGYLIATMPKERDDPWDDGARL